MKITKLLMLSVAVILFSCGDDEDFKATSEGMVGAWQITAVDYKGTSTTTAQGMNLKADFSGTGKDMSLVKRSMQVRILLQVREAIQSF